MDGGGGGAINKAKLQDASRLVERLTISFIDLSTWSHQALPNRVSTRAG